MKTTQLFTAIALTIAAASGPVLAQEATYEYPQPIVSKTTRAAVLAELQAARAEGTLQVNEASAGHTSTTIALKTRDGVRAEAHQGMRDGTSAALVGEPQGFTVNLPAAAKTAVASK